MDAGSLSTIGIVSSVGAPDRRRGNPPAAITLIGLGIACVTAAVTLVISRSSSAAKARGPAARKKVHTARSGSLLSECPQDTSNKPVAASDPATTTALASAEETFPVHEPVLCESPGSTGMAEQNVINISTSAAACALPERSVPEDFNTSAPGPATIEGQSPPLVAASCSPAAAAADGSVRHTSGPPGVLMAELPSLSQTSAATIAPNGGLSVSPHVQPLEERQMADQEDQAQAEPIGTAQEAQQLSHIQQHGVTDKSAPELPAADIGKISEVSDDAGTALADQRGELDAATLVRTALEVDDGENGKTAEEVEPQSEVEAEAEQLLLAATTAWNVHGNRAQGVKLAKKALAKLRTGPHRAKYRSDVASSLADMLYGMNRWEEALEAVGEAREAARAAGEWAMAIKLTNNMGAVYKKLARYVVWFCGRGGDLGDSNLKAIGRFCDG
ncbi:hypothetical protein Vretimale_18748 [Volvox reticuliferus]|uniref:Uncharacterized protein n=1 Tax=Volvox reticuliferus TaxID=1737510 RepID=A0A8J4GVJ8_9CHLO|nr:hypothetical protein Vretifemale_19056 [Volvox reticuliferus]GIM16092.1 hypothetical protein Vretimale_18748 [Volvox reticuliferus]